VITVRVLWVSAHPDPRSLSGALRDHGVAVLRGQGHEVVESDLYALRWNPVVDHADFAHDTAEHLDVLVSVRKTETQTETAT
jgi:NAD(P)H dehydrogenase (quinone)